MGKRNWFKLHEEWATSKKLRKVTRRFGPVAAAYRALVLGRAYACSHYQDNPMGEIDCSLQDLADDLYDRHNRADMWQMMIDTKILTIKGFRPDDLESPVRIRVVGFNEWQTVKGSSADRKAKSRENQKHADLQGSVTGSPNYVTQTETETYIETEITSSSNPPNPPSRVSAPPREASESDGLKMEWVHECADLMLPYIAGAHRNTLTQTLADAQVYGTGVKGRRRYEPDVFVAAAKSFADALQSGGLNDPARWWSYYVAILPGVALGGEAKDSAKAQADADAERIQRIIREEQEAWN